MVRILFNELLDLDEMPTNKMILKHIINVLSNFYYSLLILVSNNLTFLSIEDMVCHLQIKDEHFHKMKPNEEALVFYFNKFIQNHGLWPKKMCNWWGRKHTCICQALSCQNTNSTLHVWWLYQALTSSFDWEWTSLQIPTNKDSISMQSFKRNIYYAFVQQHKQWSDYNVSFH
jgi:hypothetical protein